MRRLHLSFLLSTLLVASAVSALPLDAVLPPPLPLPLSNAQLAASARLACRPAGHCEICPESQMLEPACRVYGNRRLVHCLVLDVPEPQVHGAPPPSMPPAQEQAVEVPAEKEVTKAEKLKEPVKAPAKPHSTEDVHPHLLDDGGKAKQAPDAGLSAAAQKEYDQSGQLPPGQAEQAEKPREDKTTLVSASASTTTAAPPLRYRLKRASFDASHPMIGGSLQQTFASWEPCARAIETERNDFWEFILCNLTFATVALFVIVIRGRILAGRRFNAIMSSVGYPIHLLTQSALRPT